MTYSGCCSGNVDGGKDNLKPEYYEEFAHYLVDVCKHYKDTYGIEFATLEPFNESATSFWYANGPQEGCHFDGRSQIAFIKVLAPILKASGLNTVISSSDETSVPISVSIFEEYQRDGKVLDLVGQWNTHTYSADDVSRSRIGSLARSEGKKTVDERDGKRRKRHWRQLGTHPAHVQRHPHDAAIGMGGLAIRGGSQRPVVHGAREFRSADLFSREELLRAPTSHKPHQARLFLREQSVTT
jgi:hypothetical protein